MIQATIKIQGREFSADFQKDALDVQALEKWLHSIQEKTSEFPKPVTMPKTPRFLKGQTQEWNERFDHLEDK